MEINNQKLNKKNFWRPFLISSISSFLIIFLVLIFWFDYFPNGIIDYIYWLIRERFFILIILAIFVSLPSFFIIKKLLSQNPKKVFYLELPILATIYSFLTFSIFFIGLLIGGPIGITKLQIFGIIMPPIIFIIIWISILTISLYFYYKKSKIINPKNL